MSPQWHSRWHAIDHPSRTPGPRTVEQNQRVASALELAAAVQRSNFPSALQEFAFTAAATMRGAFTLHRMRMS